MKIFMNLDPDCYWLIKWIDRIQLGGHGAESPLVSVFLERLSSEDLTTYTSASNEKIWYLLGRRPKAVQQGTSLVCSRILVGYLALVRIGDIVHEGKVVGYLPSCELDITAQQYDQEELECSAPIERPEGWTATAPHTLLNPYELDGIRSGGDLTHARCQVFRKGGLTIIIPKAVIFRTFYGCHSKLVQALCRRPWEHAAKDVISFKSYESGIETKLDEQTGAWKIVLEMGIPLEFAPQIALLWFSAYARPLTNRIYTDALLSAGPANMYESSGWLIDVKIPHAFSENDLPFKMQLKGYYLRPYKVYGGESSKFLVRSIAGYSWSLPDQEILWEIANSNTTGLAYSGSHENRPFVNKPPVMASPDAIGTSVVAPDPHSAVNFVETQAPLLLNQPKMQRQEKSSSKSYSSSTVTVPQGPDSVVSVAEPIHGEGRPSQAAVEDHHQRPVDFFQHIIDALTKLKDRGDIEDFEQIPAPREQGTGVNRNGLSCWSFESLSKKNHTHSSNWDSIRHKVQVGAGVFTKHPYPRTLLVLRILIQGRNLVLMEVEPSPTESACRMYTFREDHPLDPTTIEQIMVVLRSNEGRVPRNEVREAFNAATASSACSFKHSYKYEDKAVDGEKKAIGIREDLLLNAFRRALR